MKKWLVRIFLAIAVLAIASGVVTFFVIEDAVDTMFGGATPVAQPGLAQRSPDRFVLANVSVLGPAGEEFRPRQSILVEDGVIRAVGPSVEPAGSIAVIDGSGLFAVPGYTDSHVHLWNSPNDLLLYLANGVTQVREMHGRPHHLQWKQEIESGRLGPDMYVVAAQLASYGLWEGLWVGWTSGRNVVRSPPATARRIESLVEQGYDAVKASSFLSREAYAEAGRASREMSVPLVGHLPLAAGLPDLWASNQSEVAHVEELVKALGREFGGLRSTNAEAFLAHVRARRGEIAERLAANGIHVTSTLALSESFGRQAVDLEGLLPDVALGYVNPGVAQGDAMGWVPGVNPYRVPDAHRNEGWRGRNEAYWAAYAQAHHLMLEALLDAGVTILVGTDANVPVMVPGFSMHEEMQALVAAGMRPAQVLASATSLPGRWMEWNTGRIEEGFRANLVLLRENPLEDIGATASIETVVVNGRVLSRADLDAMLRAVEAANRQAGSPAIAD
ncbi:amidohydrolase family protein [Luteimonas sp. RD2P54]|uniref:Amidohydrolase family protein n=1 Tax=Luteimonas endophytica TaxID=3042023 RepID=A0ABT6J4K2_9GAMM|nr:amidohydrolase family protein [Luteimonas endophytica]MDH5821704.1 amidohydrolase family protein [Luteimonas endophytica]